MKKSFLLFTIFLILSGTRLLYSFSEKSRSAELQIPYSESGKFQLFTASERTTCSCKVVCIHKAPGYLPASNTFRRPYSGYDICLDNCTDWCKETAERYCDDSPGVAHMYPDCG